MNIFKLYLISTLFIAVSCGGSPSDLKYVAPEFKEILNRSVTVLNDEFLYRSIDYVVISDSLLITAFQTPSTSGYFHIFNKYTGKYLKSFGGIGRGPGELTHPLFSALFRITHITIW